jgi:GntR family transcriptional regulator/MocR family aminotransferase
MSKTAGIGSLIALAIDRRGATPLYQQIVDRLREAIEDGRVATGTRLPSTRILADELSVSRNTVIQVFETLTGEGFLASRVGAGTFVTGRDRDDVQPARREAERSGSSGAYPFRSLSGRGKNLLRSATGEFVERPTPFMPDLPDLREFPIRTWLRLLNETSGRLTGEILADTTNAGYEPLRRAIAQHLNASRGMACDFSQIIITTGSQQGLDLICRLLIDPGDPIWHEEPGYIGARAVMSANGASIYPVPADERGLCVEDAQARLPAPRMIFVSPARHYPLGGTLSMERRKLLLDVARRSGAWIVEDDYDHEFRYAGAPSPAIQGLDRDDRTLQVGTFSKILLPSFRLGYIVVPRDLSPAFAKARAVLDRHASLIEQMAISEFMLRGLFVAHVRRMRSLYRARQAALVSGLAGVLGRTVPLANLETGTHVILPLKPTASDTLVAKALAAQGVIVRPLSPYYAGTRREQGLLFGFSAYDEGEIEQGLRRLHAARDVLLPALTEP